MTVVNNVFCTGCGACVESCPKKCMKLVPNGQGFLYPVIDANLCVNCGKCNKICPLNNAQEAKTPMSIFVTRTNDSNYLDNSSSGGVFSELASYILKNKGVVFGASFAKNFEVEHRFITDVSDLPLLQGSKYVQSKLNNSYESVLEFLNEGRLVLFSGTPCQVAGLKAFLKYDFDNLLCIDFICHGVPSPYVWQDYLNRYVKPTISLNSENLKISFRDKMSGWSKFSLSVKDIHTNNCLFSQSVVDNLYLKGFVSNLYLRKSCYNCHFKSLRGKSDITLADCWGIDNILDDFMDDRGASYVIINSEKGKNAFERCGLLVRPIAYDFLRKYNPSIDMSVRETKGVSIFWKNFDTMGFDAIFPAIESLKPSNFRCFLSYIKHKINNWI